MARLLDGLYLMDWAEFKALLDSQPASFRPIEITIELAGGDEQRLIGVDGPVVYVCDLQPGSADYTDWTDNYKSKAAGIVGPRYDPVDGSLIVKADPGTPFTDPRHDSYQITIAAAGVTEVELAGLLAGERIQGIELQLLGAVKGDEIGFQFVSDGTQEATFGPAETVVLSFGRINAPQPRAAGEWSYYRREFGTSKELLAGLKVELVYDAVDGATREVLVTLLMQA